jgi:hypothetical protein
MEVCYGSPSAEQEEVGRMIRISKKYSDDAAITIGDLKYGDIGLNWETIWQL